MHSKAENIHQAYRHAKRREYIFTKVWSNSLGLWKPLHFFSKNKIHCSCPMCSGYEKTNSSVVKNNWKHSDRKKLLKELDNEID